MAKLYDADEAETLEAINTTWGGDVEAYKQDNVRRCLVCLILWDTQGDDFTGFASVEGGYVCEEICLDTWLEENDGDNAEHSTYHARNGSVVG